MPQIPRFRLRSLLIFISVAAIMLWGSTQRPFWVETTYKTPDQITNMSPDGMHFHITSSEITIRSINPRIIWFWELSGLAAVGLLVWVVFQRFRNRQQNNSSATH
jgi:hypothetical protein